MSFWKVLLSHEYTRDDFICCVVFIEHCRFLEYLYLFLLVISILFFFALNKCPSLNKVMWAVPILLRPPSSYC